MKFFNFSKNKYIQGFVFFLVCIFLLWGGIGNYSTFNAFAESKSYSNVLSDLQKDDTFDLSKYPDNPNDYSIQVIQIAESTEGELFIYTYQPAQRTTYLVATDVNMSLSEYVDGTNIYNLELLSCSGNLCKYLVNGVKVSNEDVRYYNITSIYREFVDGIDLDLPTVTPVINSVSYKVGKLFIVNTNEQGETIYYQRDVEVIQIINPYYGYIRYFQGFKLYESSCDSHCVFFSTDKQIDKLISASVSFVTQEVSWRYLEDDYVGPKEHHTIPLSYTESAISEKDGLFGKTYSWNRIEKVSDFLKNEDEIDSSIVKQVKDKEWVLRFYESVYYEYDGYGWCNYDYTKVSEVTILRLEFETNGVLYNLGAVSDKVSGSGMPMNNTSKEDSNFLEFLIKCCKNVINGNFSVLDLFVFICLVVVGVVLLVFILRIIYAIIRQFTR